MYTLRRKSEKFKTFPPPRRDGVFQVHVSQIEAIEAKHTSSEKFPKLEEITEKMSYTIHFGQVLPLQDVQAVMDIAYPITTFPCDCRRTQRRPEKEKNYFCMGFGVGMYRADRWLSDVTGPVEVLEPEEAKKWFADLNKRGFVHTIYTMGTPYIGAVCNCEYPVCLALRSRLDYEIKYLFKGEYVAKVDYSKCNGCGRCVQRCQFGAIRMEVSQDKANINAYKCFGCGLCETGCPRGAINLVKRTSLPALRNVW